MHFLGSTPFPGVMIIFSQLFWSQGQCAYPGGGGGVGATVSRQHLETFTTRSISRLAVASCTEPGEAVKPSYQISLSS